MKLHLIDAQSGETHDVEIPADTPFNDFKRMIAEKFGISTFVVVLGGRYLNHGPETTLEKAGIVSGDKLRIYRGAVSAEPQSSSLAPPEPRPHRDFSSADLPADAPNISLGPEQQHRVRPHGRTGDPDVEFFRPGDDPSDPLRTRGGHNAPNPNPLQIDPRRPLAPLGHPGGPLGPNNQGFDPFNPAGELMPGRPRHDPTAPRIFPFNPTDRDYI
ncbi:unnamed protein product, partial [Mesorhabditis spiculigera]